MTITYEQPANEQVRVCLRIKQLLTQIRGFLDSEEQLHSRIALNKIIELVNLLDRPDLKTKLTKDFHKHCEQLARLQRTPQIDHSKLNDVLDKLKKQAQKLAQLERKFAQNLRDNDFINGIRQYLNTPGGGCSFDTPAYHTWLNQDPMDRINNLQSWYSEFDLIHETADLLLNLLRDSAHPKSSMAEKGFFQTGLDPQAQYQLVRVTVEGNPNYYPEISLGKHRLVIRFLQTDFASKSTQVESDVKFDLSLCGL